MEAPDLSAHPRFRVVSRLGAGGLGTVYAAEDSERGEKVALKVFTRRDSHNLFWLKREFRSLADLQHPNLIALYELFADGSDARRRRQLLERARRLAKQLAGEAFPVAASIALLLDAGIANVDKERGATVAALTRAIEQLEERRMMHFAMAARRQLGVSVGGDEGAALIAEADAWMEAQGVKRPDRYAACHVPGWPHPDA